jgi:hypothetical protein
VPNNIRYVVARVITDRKAVWGGIAADNRHQTCVDVSRNGWNKNRGSFRAAGRWGLIRRTRYTYSAWVGEYMVSGYAWRGRVIESWLGEDSIPCTYIRYLAELAVNFEIIKVIGP